jgi:hypothetical protein
MGPGVEICASVERITLVSKMRSSVSRILHVYPIVVFVLIAGKLKATYTQQERSCILLSFYVHRRFIRNVIQ